MAASKSKQAQSKQAQARASQAKAAQAQQARADRDRRPAGQSVRQNGESAGASVPDNTPPPPPRVKGRHPPEIAPPLRGEFGSSNLLQIPRPSKILVNMGVRQAAPGP